MSKRKHTNCLCAYEPSPMLTTDDSRTSAVAARTWKIYLAPGNLIGVLDWQRRIINAFAELAAISATVFLRIPTSTGARTRIYPASNEMLWKWFPSMRKQQVVPLGARKGNVLYLASELTPSGKYRWGTEDQQIVEAVGKHEFGHQLGLRHVSDTSSIMHPWLPSVTLNKTDVTNFQRRLGKPR